MKYLLTFLLFASTVGAQAGVVFIPNSGYSMGGNNLPLCTPLTCTIGPGNGTSTQGAAVPRINQTTTLQYEDLDGFIGPTCGCVDTGSTVGFMVYGASRVDLPVSAAITGDEQHLQIPSNDSQLLATSNGFNFTAPLIIPNDPTLIGKKMWVQGTQFYTDNGVTRFFLVEGTEITIQP